MIFGVAFNKTHIRQIRFSLKSFKDSNKLANVDLVRWLTMVFVLFKIKHLQFLFLQKFYILPRRSRKIHNNSHRQNQVKYRGITLINKILFSFKFRIYEAKSECFHDSSFLKILDNYETPWNQLSLLVLRCYSHFHRSRFCYSYKQLFRKVKNIFRFSENWPDTLNKNLIKKLIISPAYTDTKRYHKLFIRINSS